MAYNKFIRSGNNFELYTYELQSHSRGRPAGYQSQFKRENLENRTSDEVQYSNSAKYRKRVDNARRASMGFRRLILSNLRTDENPLLVTLTFSENRTTLSECNVLFALFIHRMRNSFGNSFKYIGVPEFQKRGAVHYHVLFWGLPQGIYASERQSRTLATIWGQGFVFIKQTDGNERLSSYLAKYMVKAINDPRLFYHRAYYASRNVLRPVVSSGFPLWWAEEEYGLIPEKLKVLKKFETKWQGNGSYSLYDLS